MKKQLLTGLMLIISGLGISQTIQLQSFATGFSSPVAIEHAQDGRLFVVERGGNIKILNPDGTINPTPFLALNNTIVLSGGERGLLGLAFHPDYANNGYFFVNYTRAGDGATVIARYEVSSNPNIANAASAEIILTVSQPYSNHNGGTIAFGPDGYLYIGMGDGGSGGDPQNFAQNINSLLGKMLRIDVNNGLPYTIPPTNPFVGNAGADEIWSVGMRNPWKFSFKRNSGDLWIADVGQNAKEEINRVTAPLTPGLNFGWRCYEADVAFNTNGCSNVSNYTFPVSSYPLTGSFCSVTGGYEYTGTMYPSFQNKYFFADYCANRIGWIANTGGEITWTNALTGNFSTFGEDQNGELYVAGLSNGIIYKMIDPTMSQLDFSKVGLKMYPNPTQSQVVITSENEIHWNSIHIFDMTGKLVYQSMLDENLTHSFSVDHLAKGIYTVKITNKEQFEYVSKLVINSL
jgi:glucose/arabinose dehydrogenase